MSFRLLVLWLRHLTACFVFHSATMSCFPGLGKNREGNRMGQNGDRQIKKSMSKMRDITRTIFHPSNPRNVTLSLTLYYRGSQTSSAWAGGKAAEEEEEQQGRGVRWKGRRRSLKESEEWHHHCWLGEETDPVALWVWWCLGSTVQRDTHFGPPSPLFYWPWACWNETQWAQNTNVQGG